MKKILLLAAFSIAAMTAGAQNVKFYYNGTEVAKDQTLVYNDVNYDDVFGEYMIKPDVKIKATKQASVVVKVVCTTGQDVNLCFGGQCGAAATTVTSNQITMAAGETQDLQYDYSSDAPINYIVSTDVYVIDPISEATVNKITLKFDPNAGSVKGVSADDSINFRNGIISLNSATTTNFTLFSCSGQKIAAFVVNGHTEFNTSDLLPDVYVYTIGGKTGKILVK